MIDTDKYEGHTPAPWEQGEYIPSDEMIERFRNRELQGAVMQQGSNLMLAMIGLDGNGEKDRLLMADAPLLLAAYDKQVRWINDILFRLERMDEASTGQRLRFLLTVQEELETMIE